MTYAEKLKDPRWQRKRLEILNRDNFTCRNCGATKEQLHVHHVHYQKGDPWDTQSDLLLTVCSECHLDREEIEHDIKLTLGRLMSLMTYRGGGGGEMVNLLFALEGMRCTKKGGC